MPSPYVCRSRHGIDVLHRLCGQAAQALRPQTTLALTYTCGAASLLEWDGYCFGAIHAQETRRRQGPHLHPRAVERRNCVWPSAHPDQPAFGHAGQRAQLRLDRQAHGRPRGLQRINKTTGKEIAPADIAKGIEVEDGHYVLLTPEELEAAYPKTLQTIEIEAFVPINEIPFVYLEKPYYIAPINKGSKVYALLRETLKDAGKVGLSKVVIANNQHLAVLMPCGPALILNLLRWGEEVRSWQGLALPTEGRKELKTADLKMAQQLVEEMSTDWHPEAFQDSFREQVMQLVEKKAKAGQLMEVSQLDTKETVAPTATVLDLTEMLRRSLASGKRTPPARKAPPAKSAGSAQKTVARKSAKTRAPKAA